MNAHRLAEERSLAYHRAIATRLRHDSKPLDMARERVESWLRSGQVHRTYASAWQNLLSHSLDEIEKRLVEPTEEMRALRQCTPFAGALDPRERWRIWREVGDRVAGR